MRTGRDGVELIRHFEGCRFDAYLCPAGVWTIGYGHTADVKEGDSIDQEAAEAFLIEDLETFERNVTNLVKVPLTQQQFDALVSWTFNLGPGNLERSTLLAKLNQGEYTDVPFEIKRWTRAGGAILPGLVKRRNAEAALFEGRDWKGA